MAKSLLGIDVGDYSIKIVELRYDGALKLGKYAVIPTPKFDETTPVDEKEGAIADLIRKFINEERVKTRQAVVSVGGPSVLVRYTTFSKVSKQETKNAIKLQIDQYLPVNIEDVEVDIDIIGEVREAGEIKNEVMIVSADKSAIEAKMRMFKKTGLTLQAIDVEQIALGTMYEVNYFRPASQESSLIIDIGKSHSILTTIENNIPRVIRYLPIGSENFTKNIQSTLNVDYEKAEEIKLKCGLIEEPIKQNDYAATQVLRKSVDEIVSEIQKSIDYYYSTRGEYFSVTRVILSGGGALLYNLDSHIQKLIKLPTFLADPFLQIEKHEEIPREISPLFSVSVGLAARVMS